MVTRVDKNCRKRRIDGTQPRRFERFAICADGRVEVDGAGVELFGEIFWLGIQVTEHTANNHEQEKQDDTTKGDFDNRAIKEFGLNLVGGFDRTIGLRNLIKIFKTIHDYIITQLE